MSIGGKPVHGLFSCGWLDNSGGSLWGVSAAAKAGFSTEKGTKEVTAGSEKQEQIHVTYNVSRYLCLFNAC